MTAPLTTPVALFVFNRPEVTARNLAVLRQARPERLFVIADGPRPGNPDDERLCGQVRDLIAGASWAQRVDTRFAERNMGLEGSVELGLDWVFGQVDRAIVLEDDCIADPTFFPFCEELLERYAGDPRVWQIAGDTHLVPEEMFAGFSYAFSTWASVWGWATWADRWCRHRALFPRDHDGAEDRAGQIPRTADARRVAPAGQHPGSLVTAAARRHFAEVAATTDGDARGWDHHWWVTIIEAGGLSAVPATNLVENDGYGAGATHTRSQKEPYSAAAIAFPLRHPPVELNPDVERELELVLLRTDGRLSRVARRLIRPLWMRALVQRVLSLPPVWRAVRRFAAR